MWHVKTITGNVCTFYIGQRCVATMSFQMHKRDKWLLLISNFHIQCCRCIYQFTESFIGTYNFLFIFPFIKFVCKIMRNKQRTVIDLEKELYGQNRVNEWNLKNHNNKILEYHKQKMYTIEIRLDKKRHSNFNWCYSFVCIWIECAKGIFFLRNWRQKNVPTCRSFVHSNCLCRMNTS